MTMTPEDTSEGAVAALPDMRPLHQRACERFAQYVQQIKPAQWRAPTPCTEWDVRTLVDHVVRWNTFIPQFMAGRSLAEMPGAFESDILGNDAAAAAQTSGSQAIVAFETPGALERIVHHPFGEMPGVQVLYQRLFDVTIHGWDLARALGIDATIDRDIVEFLYASSLPQRDQIRASGHFGPAEIPVSEGADTQSRLLGLLGREP